MNVHSPSGDSRHQQYFVFLSFPTRIFQPKLFSCFFQAASVSVQSGQNCPRVCSYGFFLDRLVQETMMCSGLGGGAAGHTLGFPGSRNKDMDPGQMTGTETALTKEENLQRMKMSPSWLRVRSSVSSVMGSSGPMESSLPGHPSSQMAALLGRVSSLSSCPCSLSSVSLDLDSATKTRCSLLAEMSVPWRNRVWENMTSSGCHQDLSSPVESPEKEF